MAKKDYYGSIKPISQVETITNLQSLSNSQATVSKEPVGTKQTASLQKEYIAPTVSFNSTPTSPSAETTAKTTVKTVSSDTTTSTTEGTNPALSILNNPLVSNYTSNIKIVQVNLNNFATNLGKIDKYTKLAKNLETLSEKYQKTRDDLADRKSLGANIVRGVGGALSFIPYIGGAINSIAGLIGNSMDKEASDTYSKWDVRATKIQQMSENILGYMDSLQNRDSLINEAMTGINSALGEMKLTYGDSFVDQFYNLMLAKSKMASNEYSLLTGNFRTFGKSEYGTQSGDSGWFDELTSGNGDMFNNFYAQLTANDLEGINATLTQALYSSNTTLGEELRKYEADVQTTMESFINSQDATLEEAMSSLETALGSVRQENISYAEQLGSAEAERATSGFRGGTATANEALSRLSADLSKIANSAQVASIIANYRNAMRQQELNASSTAYNYRVAQKQTVLNAKYAMLNSFNNVANKTAQIYENEANKQLIEAGRYQANAEENIEDMNFSEEDMNIIMDSL